MSQRRARFVAPVDSPCILGHGALVNALELAKALPTLMDIHQATFIWGPPGIGKSSVVSQVAATHGMEVRDIRLAMCDPTDLRGIPFYDPEHKIARWAPPEFLPRDGRGIVFLDELNAAPPAVQAAAYQLVLDRRLGEYELPKGWAILAAGNRHSDMGVVFRLPSPLANRFCHLDLDVDLQAWRRWAFSAGVHAGVIGFLSFRPELLFVFDREKASRAFPTPRSWVFAARALSSPGLDRQSQRAVVAGCVGDGPAIELLAFLEVADKLPDPDAILDGKIDVVPREISVLYALIGRLLYALKNGLTDERRDRFLTYSLKLPAELAVMGAKEAFHLGLELGRSPKWKAWIGKFGEFVV